MYEHNIIVAICRHSRGIGYRGGLPWYIPEELKHFKKETTKNYCKSNNKIYDALYMGRNTYKSLKKPLPKRDLFVISKDPSKIDCHIPCMLFTSVEKCKEYISTRKYKSLWCIGGGETYKHAIHDTSVDRIIVSEIQNEYKCDVYLPYLPKYFVQQTNTNTNKTQLCPKLFHVKTYLNTFKNK